MNNNYMKVEHELHILADRLCEELDHSEIMDAFIKYAKLHKVYTPGRKLRLEDNNE